MNLPLEYEPGLRKVINGRMNFQLPLEREGGKENERFSHMVQDSALPRM